MKAVIDNLTSATGMAATNATVTATTWPMFASSWLSGQVQFNMQALGSVSKTFTAIQTPYQNIAFNIVAKDNDKRDFRLKFRIYQDANTYKEYYVPLKTQFLQVRFKHYYTSVIKYEFIAIEAVEFFACEMINYTDQIPIDLYTGCMERVRYAMETLPEIGRLTCSAGARSVTITNPKYLDKYLTFKVGNEIHQIDEITQGKAVTFTAFGNGKAMVGSFSNEPVYLYLPTEIEPGEFFIFEPGYSFTEGFPCTPVESEEHYSFENDSFETSGINRTRRIGPYFEYTVRVQTMARHGKIAEILIRILKKAFATAEYIWINGQKHEAECPEGIQQQPNGDATDIQNIYFCDVKIIASEEIWPEETQQTAELNITKTVAVIQ